jgi:peptide-methionine (R)-S-oxide reductase
MRYLLLPLVAAFAFSSCSYEPMDQPILSGDVEIASATTEGEGQNGVKPMAADGLSASRDTATRDTGTPQTPLAADVAKQPVTLNQPKTPKQKQAMSYNKLTAKEAYVIQEKGTEAPGVGEYTDNKADGLYICRQCNAELYRSTDKFQSNCGWPSFDDEIAGAVERHEDGTLGMVRVEIVCTNCKGHLGHVFAGERMTEKNTRHCVNSISMKFVPAGVTPPSMLIVKPK